MTSVLLGDLEQVTALLGPSLILQNEGLGVDL